jgi:hypothetical protein
MRGADALAIQRQASQRVQVGLERDMTIEQADELASEPEAWTAEQDDRIVACLGLRETFVGVQAVAWAILAEGVGSAHLAVTRFARGRIAGSGLRRIEAVVRAGVPAECTWAKLVGLDAAHVLRNFGARSETHVLYERIS